MRNLPFIPLFLVLILSACEPRDVKVLSDSERAKGRGFNAQNSDKFLGNFSVATHLVERQVELLTALEMLQSPGLASSLGYTRAESRNDEAVVLVKIESTEDLGQSKKESSVDQWLEKKDAVIGNSETKIFTGPKDKDKVDLALKVIDLKKATIKKTADSSYEIDYEIRTDLFRGVESYTIVTKMKFKAKQNGDKFVVDGSKASLEASKIGDAKFRKSLVVALNDGFVIGVNGCAFAQGTIAMHALGKEKLELGKSLGELEISEKEIKEKGTKKDLWSEPLLVCANANSRRPILDFHRLLR